MSRAQDLVHNDLILEPLSCKRPWGELGHLLDSYMIYVLHPARSSDVKGVECGRKQKYSSSSFQGDPGDIGIPGKKGEKVKLLFL